MIGKRKKSVTIAETPTSATKTKMVESAGKSKFKMSSNEYTSDDYTKGTGKFRKEKMKGGKITTVDKSTTFMINPKTGKKTKLVKSVIKGKTTPGEGTVVKTKYKTKGLGGVKIVKKKMVG